ncbi:hypothetical protein JCGZ_22914 [Jatropha curcas]|uniref:Pentacotripeptide-repeat region of PRORP domain-containing protein n=1 Tax=Jatropha curcas TaxID=180498 RepID=A0A067LI75_JATCU|nr:hypothetical protein JCGZ_22914 [Jatropha curcas]
MMSTRSGRCLTVFRIRRPMDIFGSVSFSSSKSSTHLRGKGNSDSFHNIDDCLASFNLMLHSNPPSPIKEFSKLLSALVRMKHYATVISLSEQMEMEDKFGEAVDLVDDIVEKGSRPDFYTYTVIVNGLCKIGKTNVAIGILKRMVEKAGKVNDAKELFSRLSIEGLHPDVCTYTIIVKGLCKEGLLDEALKVFRKMEGNGCSPDDCSYNVIIQGYLQHNDLSMAKQLIDEMVGKGFSADATTMELVVNNDLLVKKLLSCSTSSQGVKLE